MYPKSISEEIPILKWFGHQQILFQHQYEKSDFQRRMKMVFVTPFVATDVVNEGKRFWLMADMIL